MSKITYANKVAINENAEISDINKVTDSDMNEIKTVVNNNDDELITINTKLTNITGQILWTNEYPTQAMTQTNITLSSSDYDILEIFFVHKADNNFSTYSIRMLKNSVGTRCFMPSTDGIVYRVITKNTDTSITVNSVTGSVDNSLAVPLYIIGYKTGLFN